MKYRTWLLIHESPNEELEFLLQDLGVFARLDLTERPQAELEIQGEEVILASPDPASFFDAIFEHRSVEAFCSLPLDQLKKLDGRAFFHRARFIQISRLVPEVRETSDPYCRRMLRIDYMVSALQGDFDLQRTRVEKRPLGGGHPILSRPISFEIDEKHMGRIFGSQALALRGINGYLLPPLAPEQPDSYFSASRIALRDEMRETLGIVSQKPGEPTAIAMQRILHDPLLRDVFLEGGALRFTGEDGQPTRLALDVFGLEGGGPLQSYRAQTLLSPQQVPGQPWAKSMAEAIAADVRGLLPEGLEILPLRGAEPSSFRIASSRAYEGSPLPEGSWQRLEQTRTQLEVREHRQMFDELVLWPSRARGSSSPDHDLAERQFIANFWRCPWTRQTDRGPWRYALLDLLRYELDGLPMTVQDRVESWADEGWPWIDSRTSDRMLLVVHRPYPIMSEDDLKLWRLLLPVGAVLKAGGTIRLNDVTARLNSGFALA